MQTKARWATSFEPQMSGLLFPTLFPSLFGISQPGFTSRESLFVAALTSAVMALIVCGWSYSWLRLGTKNQKAVQDSREASATRQKIGYVAFGLRLVLFFWMMAVLMVSAVWLVFRAFNGSSPSFSLCLLRGLVVGTIAAFGFFVQALALDRFYRHHP